MEMPTNPHTNGKIIEISMIYFRMTILYTYIYIYIYSLFFRQHHESQRVPDVFFPAQSSQVQLLLALGLMDSNCAKQRRFCHQEKSPQTKRCVKAMIFRKWSTFMLGFYTSSLVYRRVYYLYTVILYIYIDCNTVYIYIYIYIYTYIYIYIYIYTFKYIYIVYIYLFTYLIYVYIYIAAAKINCWCLVREYRLSLFGGGTYRFTVFYSIQHWIIQTCSGIGFTDSDL